MEDTGPLWVLPQAVTGPATMLTQLQSPHLICIVAYSGPSGTAQPHTYWGLRHADTLEAEGPGKRKAPRVLACGLPASVVGWPQLPRLLGALLAVVL